VLYWHLPWGAEEGHTTEGLLASKMQIDSYHCTTKTKGLLVSQIQAYNITTTPHKPQYCWCPKYKTTVLPQHHKNQRVTGVLNTSRQCYHYTTWTKIWLVSQIQVNSVNTAPQKPKGCWCPKYRCAVLPLCSLVCYKLKSWQSLCWNPFWASLVHFTPSHISFLISRWCFDVKLFCSDRYLD
jgi:hypothetical protein